MTRNSVTYCTPPYAEDPHHVPMASLPPEMLVAADTFRVSRESVLLTCEVRAALAVCVHDDTQGVGGLLHLRYVATSDDKPLDLTDNTLSSDLLLMDRFCKELRALGARKQSWRVSLFAHTPGGANMEGPAATVLDLVKAYFSDGRHPLECKEMQRELGLLVRFDAREGRAWVMGTPGTVPNTRLAAPAIA
jgi:chemotaxis receptor (MCP) glutamine deamidase CheD